MLDIDILWLIGDLVVCGFGLLDVLCYVKLFGNSVCLVLGNYDLYLLVVFVGISCNKFKDWLILFFEVLDVDELLNWLCCQLLLQVDEEKKLIMVYVGIILQWDLQMVKECVCDVEVVLLSDLYLFFFDVMYGDMLNNWLLELSGLVWLCFIINVFICMCYCFFNG